MLRLGLGGRLSVVFAALAVVVTLIVTWATLVSTNDEVNEDVDKFLRERSEEITSGARGQPPEGNRRGGVGAAIDQDDVQRAVEADAVVQQLDEDGEIIVSLGVELPVEPIDLTVTPRGGADPVLRTIEVDGTTYRMITRHVPGGGAVQVAREIDSTNALLATIRSRALLIGAVLAVAAAVIGWLVARAATSPLRRLTASVERVAATQDLDTPIAVGGDDEIGRLAASFDDMLEALTESRRQQHQLVQDAAHELRTPLTSIRANVDLLVRAPSIDEAERQEMLGRVRSELRHLSAVVTEIVELATDSRDEREHRPLDLAAVTETAVAELGGRGDEAVVVDTEPTAVEGDEDALRRAIGNLLDNARKHGGAGTIVVTARDRTVTVFDQGPGIPEPDLGRIFDRFHRSSASQAVPGSGLGLAIVAKVVADHGGEVFARNRAEGGAAVGFSLPPATS
ncbi:MAG: HAMP domain-containing sensor histidine kinase [Actinomycetota bacterium]